MLVVNAVAGAAVVRLNRSAAACLETEAAQLTPLLEGR
jgi:hypothetical protein